MWHLFWDQPRRRQNLEETEKENWKVLGWSRLQNWEDNVMKSYRKGDIL